jgi:hypothetical protein
MIPTITVFVSQPVTNIENDLVKRFIDLGFAPLVDSTHRNSYNWFENNVKNTNHRLFTFENQNVYFYDANDLHPEMDFIPNVMIHWSASDRQVADEEWRSIREWLKYKFFTCYDYIDYLTKEITETDKFMKRPFTDKRDLGSTEKENWPTHKDHYSFKTFLIEDKDTMLYEIWKPNTDMPYTSVIRSFSKRGHRAFFPTLYICNSWGVSRHDLPFLSFMWKQLDQKDDFDMDKMLKEATEKCYPSSTGEVELEPEVYRRTIDDVLLILQTQQDGIQCNHVFNDIPEEIKQRFK